MAAPTFIQEAETAWNTSTTPKGSGNFTTQTSDVVVAVSVVEGQTSVGAVLSQTGTNVSLASQQEVAVLDYTGVEISAGVVSSGGTTSVRFANTLTALWFGGNALTFRGSDGIGASAKTNVSSGAPSLNITTTADNSAIVVAVGDWNAADGSSRTWRTVNSITPTAGNGYELTYFRDSSRYTVYIAYYPDAGAAGSKTVGLSAPGSQKYSIVALEIKGSAAASHSTSGALSSGAASVAGTATHLILHATSGALSAQAATIAGTAAHWHATTGALSAQASSVAGTATHLTLHATSGALSSQAATISGTAAHHHAATGVLSAAAATISGAADHTVAGATHTTSGALAAQDAVVAGSATHLTLHTTTGALTADVASVSGVAAHVHVSSGVLLSQAASLSGAATHFTLHATSGALTADAASVLGDAAHSVAGSHAATGALQADDAQISGAVLHTAAPAPPTVGADGASPMRKWRYYSDDEPEKPEPAKPPAQLRRLEPPTPEDPKPAPTPRKPASELLTQVRRATERNTALLDRLNRQQTDAQAMAAAAAASLAQIEAQLAESVALAEQDELRDDDNRAAINAAVLLLQD